MVHHPVFFVHQKKFKPKIKKNFQNTKGVVVFDVGGNKYRLVTTVNYQERIVVIDFALTHPEYDQGKWKDLI